MITRPLHLKRHFTACLFALCALCAFCSAIVVSRIAAAADLRNYDVVIAVADDSDLTKQIVRGLQHHFPSAGVINAWSKDIAEEIPKNRHTPLLAVGPAALRAVYAKNDGNPIFSIFTSSQTYRNITQSGVEKSPAPVTAIYADPSLSAQFKLISMLFEKPVTAAVLIGAGTEYMRPLLRQTASDSHVGLEFASVSEPTALNRALNDIKALPVLLAIPDGTIYNARSMQNILITTYRHNQPVIGYSNALVKAGGLASVASSVDDIIAQTEEMLIEYRKSGHWPAPQYPKYFSVVINEDVARSLNIVISNSIRQYGRRPVARKP